MKLLFEKAGGRRWSLTIAVVLIATGLLIAHYIGELTWRDTILGTAAVYIAGNVAQRKIEYGVPTKTVAAGSDGSDPYRNS